jgi:hypothetical protein
MIYSFREGIMVGFWSGLGTVVVGAAAGVGVIVALPVAGPVGAITLLGAVIAGSGCGIAGAIVGISVGDGDDDKERADQTERTVAEMIAKAEKSRENMERVKRRAEEVAKFYDLVVTFYAVGFSVANCDGEIHSDERRDIDESIAALLAENFPETFTRAITALYNNPPVISQVIDYVQPLADEHWDKFEDIIEVVIHSDGIVHPNELAFMEAWSIAASKIGRTSRFAQVPQAACA